jgi:glucokinase
MNRTDVEQDLPLVVAVDLGGTQMRAGVLRGPEMLSRVILQTGDDLRPERIILRLFDAIEQAFSLAGVTLAQIAGIGIGAPGPLDSRTGIVFSPPNMPGWDSVPMHDIFAEHYHVPIYVENDANAAALGEFMFGAGQGCKDIVYLTVSTGVGGGVIVDGKILEGVSGTAAELGHMTVDWHGERCSCGNIGSAFPRLLKKTGQDGIK